MEERREDWGGGVPTFNAEQLIEILKRVPPTTHVVVATPDWYMNVETLVWDEDEGMFAVTLFTADDFDTRQF